MVVDQLGARSVCVGTSRSIGTMHRHTLNFKLKNTII
jgi:hypothetical protein